MSYQITRYMITINEKFEYSLYKSVSTQYDYEIVKLHFFGWEKEVCIDFAVLCQYNLWYVAIFKYCKIIHISVVLFSTHMTNAFNWNKILKSQKWLSWINGS